MNESDNLLNAKENLLKLFLDIIQSNNQSLKLNFYNEIYDKNELIFYYFQKKNYN